MKKLFLLGLLSLLGSVNYLSAAEAKPKKRVTFAPNTPRSDLKLRLGNVSGQESRSVIKVSLHPAAAQLFNAQDLASVEFELTAQLLACPEDDIKLEQIKLDLENIRKAKYEADRRSMREKAIRDIVRKAAVAAFVAKLAVKAEQKVD
jgi:hypothetical protein